MADVPRKAEQQQERPETLFGMILNFPLRFIGVMFGSLMLAILVEWACLYFLWPSAGWHHAREMLEYELSWLSQGLLHSIVIQEPGRTATWLVQLLYDWLIVKTGLIGWLKNAEAVAQAGPRSELDLRYMTAQGVSALQTYGLAAVFTLLTFCVRLVVLTLTIPLFAMAAFIGMVDGLVRRDLRKFGAGRESSYLYHKARSSIIPLAILPWTLYLAMPISVSPLLLLLPCAALLGVSVSITVATFKKYL
ncbi:TIGR03747 family integrating conjugative element membrane protein [Pseudomonas sp. 21LCFQ02]|uniref:TIGR03747 family integrating conjugative element membrane protein n=1 Tax=Pseudomonas sp. 21LCFQ02 TaxID=2957505 RepID=UPI00209B95B2|nr:TIGR03747 family integrating conjugative element membrane protein [Pseudomonas sp. 21LCFQ02]MCO8166204.1 TIGR03747 family integrating conjugative element membrane protein [Pseudomonas sp. 21LCFQ02]